MEPEADSNTKRIIPNILVTGVPGSGKTTFCQLLNASLGFKYLPIGQMITQHHLYDSWNEEFNVPQFDDDLVLDYIQQNYDIAKGGLIFDFHSSEFFPLRFFDLIVLIRCSSDVLYKRLEQRGYNEKKIKQNVDCEIFQVVKQEVQGAYPKQKILELYNNQKGDMEKCINTTIQWLTNWKQNLNKPQEQNKQEIEDQQQPEN